MSEKDQLIRQPGELIRRVKSQVRMVRRQAGIAASTPLLDRLESIVTRARTEGILTRFLSRRPLRMDEEVAEQEEVIDLPVEETIIAAQEEEEEENKSRPQQKEKKTSDTLESFI